MGTETLRVLLIEDDPLQARLIRETLSEAEGARICCEWADCLSRGIERLARGGIDLLLLDLTLPDSWGLNTIAEVRRRVPEIPILILTGRSDDSFLAEARRMGAHGYLLKDDAVGPSLARRIYDAVKKQVPVKGR